MPYNYSLLSILGTWSVALGSHLYAFHIINTAKDNVKYDTANPRTQWDDLKAALPPDVYARSQRAQAAHTNGIETLGFWGIAVLAANLAQLPVDTLNAHSWLFLGSRVLYSILYVNISTAKLSGLRSLVWTFGIGTTFSLLWRASSALNA